MNKQELNILIVDDHVLIRDGLRVMLESSNDQFKFHISEADTAEKAIEMIKITDYDLMLIDYRLGTMTGAELAYNSLIYKPNVKILAISSYDDYSYVRSMIDAGAKGFILKSVGTYELMSAIEALLKGKEFYCSDIAEKYVHAKNTDKAKIGKVNITEREMQVLHLIGNEYSNKQIAYELHIEKRTVDNHRQNLLKKFNVKNVAGLIRIACKNDLI